MKQLIYLSEISFMEPLNIAWCNKLGVYLLLGSVPYSYVSSDKRRETLKKQLQME